jgi:hypothetical protein
MLVFEFQSGLEFLLPPHSLMALRWQNAVTSVEAPPQPGGYALFAYSTPGLQLLMRYEVPTESSVRIDVYDVLGRHRARLADHSHSAGSHALSWIAPTAGMYFIHLHSADESQVARVVVVR